VHQKLTTLAVAYYNLAVELEHLRLLDQVSQSHLTDPLI
jgi:hypothetical protein